MNRRRNFNRRDKGKREKAIMLASAVFVLTALTLTGVYVKESNVKEQDDGYIIDFTQLDEGNKTAKGNTQENGKSNDVNGNEEIDGELDYSPLTEEVGSGEIEIPGVTKKSNSLESKLESKLLGETEGADSEEKDEDSQIVEDGETKEENSEEKTENTSSQNVTVVNEKLNFQEGDTLVWPVTGNVLINFSMDKTVYFATLEQYKYNPGIVIEAAESEMITASVNGKVMDIYQDDELGNVVKMDIGNGYEIVYGQLKDIQVPEGSYVETGDLIGYVAAPTKYFSVEGCNVYFALYKDGTAINPMTCLGAQN